jgi:hypothetical protein
MIDPWNDFTANSSGSFGFPKRLSRMRFKPNMDIHKLLM